MAQANRYTLFQNDFLGDWQKSTEMKNREFCFYNSRVLVRQSPKMKNRQIAQTGRKDASPYRRRETGSD
jgi:hypothetical protein